MARQGHRQRCSQDDHAIICKILLATGVTMCFASRMRTHATAVLTSALAKLPLTDKTLCVHCCSMLRSFAPPSGRWLALAAPCSSAMLVQFWC